MPVNNTIQLRKGLSSEWASTNPVLASGEPGYDLTNSILKIGDGTNAWADLPLTASSEIYVYAKNTTTGTLYKGQAVYINGAIGANPTIDLAIASGEATSSKTLGLLKQNLAVNEFGYVVAEGVLDSVDTDGAISAGDPIWLSATTPGGVVYGLANKPYAPNHMVFLGYVLRKQLNNGKVYVKVQNGYELEELHNVAINGVTNGQFLQYNSSSGLWVSSSSGNFTTLQVNNTGVSVSGHTHTSSQITDFNNGVSGLLPVTNIVAGTGISISSNSGIFTINSTSSGGGGSVSAEDIMDVVGTGLIAGTGISVVYNDTNGSITVSLAATTVTGYEILTTTKDTFSVTPNYLLGNLSVYYNGFKLLNGEDYTATNGSTFTLSSPGASGDVVEWIGLGEPGQYASLNHTHNISDINNFGSGVSGFLPTIANSGNNRILTSTGSTLGINAESDLTFDGTNLTSPILISSNASGDEGGEIKLTKAPNATISGNVIIDNYQNKIRFFEDAGTNRGYFLDLSTGSAGVNAQIEAKSKTISIFTPHHNNPPASNFATLDTRNSILVLEFDATTEESAYFTGVIDEGRLLANGITVRIWWMADTATTGNVRWGVQFEKTGTDLDSDSFDTNAQATSAANGTSGIESVASIAITTIDSLSAGDRYRLRVYRVAADATNDTMTGDAQLIAVEVRAT